MLGDRLHVGRLNGPEITVVSGPAADVDALQAEMNGRGCSGAASPRHAMHSPLIATPQEELLRGMRHLQPSPSPPPSRAAGSNRPRDRPGVLVAPAVNTVSFSDAVETVAAAGPRLLVEIGPGHGLRMLASQLEVWGDEEPTL